MNADGSHALLLEYHTNLEIECEEHAKVTGHRLPVTAPALQQRAMRRLARSRHILQDVNQSLTLQSVRNYGDTQEVREAAKLIEMDLKRYENAFLKAQTNTSSSNICKSFESTATRWKLKARTIA